MEMKPAGFTDEDAANPTIKSQYPLPGKIGPISKAISKTKSPLPNAPVPASKGLAKTVTVVGKAKPANQAGPKQVAPLQQTTVVGKAKAVEKPKVLSPPLTSRKMTVVGKAPVPPAKVGVQPSLVKPVAPEKTAVSLKPGTSFPGKAPSGDSSVPRSPVTAPAPRRPPAKGVVQSLPKPKATMRRSSVGDVAELQSRLGKYKASASDSITKRMAKLPSPGPPRRRASDLPCSQDVLQKLREDSKTSQPFGSTELPGKGSQVMGSVDSQNMPRRSLESMRSLGLGLKEALALQDLGKTGSGGIHPETSGRLPQQESGALEGIEPVGIAKSGDATDHFAEGGQVLDAKTDLAASQSGVGEKELIRDDSQMNLGVQQQPEAIQDSSELEASNNAGSESPQEETKETGKGVAALRLGVKTLSTNNFSRPLRLPIPRAPPSKISSSARSPLLRAVTLLASPKLPLTARSDTIGRFSPSGRVSAPIRSSTEPYSQLSSRLLKTGKSMAMAGVKKMATARLPAGILKEGSEERPKAAKKTVRLLESTGSKAITDGGVRPAGKTFGKSGSGSENESENKTGDEDGSESGGKRLAKSGGPEKKIPKKKLAKRKTVDETTSGEDASTVLEKSKALEKTTLAGSKTKTLDKTTALSESTPKTPGKATKAKTLDKTTTEGESISKAVEKEGKSKKRDGTIVDGSEPVKISTPGEGKATKLDKAAILREGKSKTLDKMATPAESKKKTPGESKRTKTVENLVEPGDDEKAKKTLVGTSIAKAASGLVVKKAPTKAKSASEAKTKTSGATKTVDGDSKIMKTSVKSKPESKAKPGKPPIKVAAVKKDDAEKTKSDGKSASTKKEAALRKVPALPPGLKKKTSGKHVLKH